MKDWSKNICMFCVAVFALAPGCDKNGDDSVDDDTDEKLYQKVESGDGFSCVLLTSGEVECWGRNDLSQTDPPEIRFVEFSCGDNHCCGVNESEEVECWGDNSYMQSDPTGDSDIVSVEAGSGVHPHTCGIKKSGSVVCWGSNSDGQTATPDEMQNVIDISLGSSRTCAIESNGELDCWGFCEMQLCDVPSGNYYEIVAGPQTHSCAKNEEEGITCWGCASGWDHGQCALEGVIAEKFTLGRMTTWIIDFDGKVEYFGFPFTDYLEGEGYVPNENYIDISSGYDHVCGIKNDDKIECWGEDEFGQVSGCP